MRVLSPPYRDFTLGRGLRRYQMNGEIPLVVFDQARDIAKPSDGGLSLAGSFDIWFDGTVYLGLNAPFVVADLPATLVRAFRSARDVSSDFILRPGGARSGGAPPDNFILADNDIWSVTND